MSNVVIIEDDDRVVREITQYVMEISEDNKVRSFKSTEQFVKRYTKTSLSADLFSNEHKLGFSHYDAQGLLSLMDLDFSPSPPFETSQVTIVFEVPELRVIEVHPPQVDNIFSQTPEAIVNNKNIFSDLIPPPFWGLWEQLLKKLTSTKNQSKSENLILPIQNGSSIWLTHMKLTRIDSQKIQLTIEDFNTPEKGKAAIKREINNRESLNVQELDLLSSIDLVIFKNGLVEKSTADWVTSTRNHLKANEFFPKDDITRFIVTKYEDDGVPKSKMFHPHIDDLITLPLDRLLFLQKLDIILNLPENRKPRYLFLQTVEKDIEISKQSRLEKFNDLSIAISNPIPLKPGLASTFFFKFPNSDELMRVVTKSSISEAHPTETKLHIVNFDYFGCPKDTHIKIKTYLRNINEYKEILSFDEQDFAYYPENIFLTDEQKRMKTVLILDTDEQLRKQIKNSILENMQQVRIVEESSYYLFEKKYLLSEEEESVPLREHEIFDKKIVWKIDSKSFNFSNTVTEPKDGDMICGKLAKDFFLGPKEWKYLFEEGVSQDLLLENLSQLKMKEESSFLVDIRHADRSKRLASVTLRHDINKIEICVAPPEPDALKGDILESVDTIILNHRMLPTEFDTWYEELNKRLAKRHLNITGAPIKLIVFADTKSLSAERFNWLLEKKVESLILTPIDTKALCFHLSKVLNNNFTKYNPDNIGSYHVRWPAYVAKKAKLIAISEFGCTVHSKKPLKVGTIVFLHGFIYEKAPGQNLCAKMYSCEENPSDEGGYICYFTYFGINDSFLKYTRNWIRENYAQQKSRNS